MWPPTNNSARFSQTLPTIAEGNEGESHRRSQRSNTPVKGDASATVSQLNARIIEWADGDRSISEEERNARRELAKVDVLNLGLDKTLNFAGCNVTTVPEWVQDVPRVILIDLRSNPELENLPEWMNRFETRLNPQSWIDSAAIRAQVMRWSGDNLVQARYHPQGENGRSQPLTDSTLTSSEVDIADFEDWLGDDTAIDQGFDAAYDMAHPDSPSADTRHRHAGVLTSLIIDHDHPPTDIATTGHCNTTSQLTNREQSTMPIDNLRSAMRSNMLQNSGEGAALSVKEVKKIAVEEWKAVVQASKAKAVHEGKVKRLQLATVKAAKNTQLGGRQGWTAILAAKDMGILWQETSRQVSKKLSWSSRDKKSTWGTFQNGVAGKTEARSSAGATSKTTLGTQAIDQTIFEEHIASQYLPRPIHSSAPDVRQSNLIWGSAVFQLMNLDGDRDGDRDGDDEKPSRNECLKKIRKLLVKIDDEKPTLVERFEATIGKMLECGPNLSKCWPPGREDEILEAQRGDPLFPKVLDWQHTLKDVTNQIMKTCLTQTYIDPTLSPEAKANKEVDNMLAVMDLLGLQGVAYKTDGPERKLIYGSPKVLNRFKPQEQSTDLRPDNSADQNETIPVEPIKTQQTHHVINMLGDMDRDDQIVFNPHRPVLEFRIEDDRVIYNLHVPVRNVPVEVNGTPQGAPARESKVHRAEQRLQKAREVLDRANARQFESNAALLRLPDTAPELEREAALHRAARSWDLRVRAERACAKAEAAVIAANAATARRDPP